VLGEEFRGYARRKLADLHAQVVRCAGLCSDAQLWHRANAHSNSIGNLLLHLRGNLMQWIVAGLGGREFDRDRPAEFAQRGPLPRGPMLDGLADAVSRADAVLAGLTDDALRQPFEIQGYRVTGLAAVFHVVEHFAFHAGQIVVMTKALRDCDLSLYDEHGRRRDGRAESAP
jgi:uncharacterized damage-inducible protein DinB